MMDTVLGRLEAAAEQRGEQRGEQDALLEILEARFAAVPESVEARVRRVEDLAVLKQLIRRAATAERIEEVQAMLP
jgi:hypothetical protein